MGFDLSSIVRTRRKTFFSFFLLILLFPLLTPSGLALDDTHPSSAFPNIAGSGASEEENIDSFDVFPSTRWSETNNGYTAAISNGLLNMTDIGDGSVDSYKIQRGLRDLDGSIEIRFKVDTTATVNNVQDSPIWIELLGDGSTSNRYLFYLRECTDNAFAGQRIFISRTDGGSTDYVVSGEERVFEGNWYILRFNYDLLKSEMRIRLFFDNGSKVLDYSVHDILANNQRAQIFEKPTVDLLISALSASSGETFSTYIDYVKAPFKEREWDHFDDGGVGFITETPVGVRVEDNIDDTSQFRLTVPYLDAYSGTMTISCDDSSALVAGDFLAMWMTIFAVDADDGDLHEAIQIQFHYEEQMAPLTGPGYSILIRIDGVQEYNVQIPVAENIFKSISFNAYTREDRSKIFISMSYDNSQAAVFNFIGDAAISDVAADPSQEFVLSMFYVADFDTDVEMMARLTDIQIIEKDLVSDFVGWVDSVAEDAGNAISGGFDWFFSVIQWLASSISALFAVFFDVLFGIIDLIFDVLNDIFSELGNIITELQALAEDVATAIWNGIGDALDFITDAIAGIWNALIAILDDVIAALLLLAEDIADFIFAALEFLLVLLLDIVAALWAVLEGTLFFVWDALNLPNLIEIFDLVLVYIVEFVQWLVVAIQDVIQLVADLSWIILVIWWIWAVPVQWARANGNPLAGLGNFIEVFFYDLIPWTFLGVHVYVPQGIVAVLWMIFLLPGDFVLFTALGL